MSAERVTIGTSGEAGTPITAPVTEHLETFTSVIWNQREDGTFELLCWDQREWKEVPFLSKK